MALPVLVVGAGPSGLVCAISLARQGIPVRIFDQNPDVREVSRAVVLQPRTIELYRQIDPKLADDVIREGQLCTGIHFWVRGYRKASILYDDVSSGANQSPVAQPLVIPQNFQERALVRYLEGPLGIKVERNINVTSVDVKTSSAVWTDGDNTEHSGQFAFIVGADGNRSIVREALGSKFEGTTNPCRYFVADVVCEGLPQPRNALHLHQGGNDFLFIAPYAGNNRARFVGVLTDDREVSSLKDVRIGSLEEWKINLKEVVWFSTYKISHRVADVWQRGNVAIVGDAAHVHSPVGGQGMNTGIGDSINLAWKIATVLKNEATPSVLLPTYTAERRAFAVTLVSTTDRIFTLTMPGSFVSDLIRLYIFPNIAGVLWGVQFFRKKIYATTSQFNLTYRACNFNSGLAGVLGGGDRLLFHPVQDNWKGLNDLKWHLQTFSSDDIEDDALAAWCTTHDVVWDKFSFDDTAKEVGFTDSCYLLVRPDMYIGLAGTTDGNTAGVVGSLDSYWVDRMSKQDEGSVDVKSG